MLRVFIDADGCSVKDEVYKVTARHQIKVFVVANRWMQIPIDPNVEMKTVSGGFDAADDWIVQEAGVGDITVTSDILLADRLVKKGSRAIGPKGEEFTEDNIGNAVAGRELASHLRNLGQGGGPSAMKKTDRSRFLSELERIIQAIKNKGR